MIDPFEEFSQYAVPEGGNDSDPFSDFGQYQEQAQINPFEAHMRGFTKGVEDITHGITGPVMESGLFGEKLKQRSKELAQKRNQRYQEAMQQHPWIAGGSNVLGAVGATAPLAMVGGGGGFLANVAKNAGIGAGIGAAGYTEEPQDRLKNALYGGAAGGAISALAPAAIGAYRGIAKGFGSKAEVAKDVFQGLPKNEVDQMLAAKEAGKRSGVQLTPAEASGNPLLAQTEADIGSTAATKQAKYEFKKGQKAAQEKAVSDLLQQVSPRNTVASEEVRSTAKSIIEKKIAERQAKAAPLYEASQSEQIQPEKLKSILEDSNVQRAYRQVTESPLYKTELQDVPHNTVKVLDLVKRNIDDKISSAFRAGNNNEARILSEARNTLIKGLDEASPTYKQARAMFSEDSPAIEALKNSKIGKLANKSDEQLKGMSKEIFDTAQTDPKVFQQYRDALYTENPAAWKSMVKNEMERRMAQSKGLHATKNYGSEFYNKVLANERDFKQFLEALGKPGEKGYTAEQRKLLDLRDAFKGLINSRTGKTAAGQTETSMTKPRSFGQWTEQAYKKLIGGKYDKAALEIISDPNWEKYLPKDLKKGIDTSNLSPEDLFKILGALSARKVSEE